MKGTLEPGILPRILRDLYTGRRTGLLHVSHGDQRRSIRFRKGHIVRAETNVASERLGETLVRQGELSEEALARATEVVVRDGKKLGVALQELGIMTRERLDDALAVHVREMLLSLFAWTEGEYAFEELQSEAPVEGDISPRLPTGEMILEAVAAIGDPEIVRRELGDLERFLAPSLDPMLRFQKITLTPSDGYLLSRIDGTLTAREVLELAPMDRDEAERCVFGLICAGVVEWGERAERRVLPEMEAGRPAASPEAGAGDAEAGAEAGAGGAPAGTAEVAQAAAETPAAAEARAAEAARTAAETTTRAEDPEAVRSELGELGRRLRLAADPTTRSGRMTPADGFLLSRVDGTLSAREVLDLAPMEREDAERSLLGLIRSGVLAWEDADARAPEAEAPAPGPPAREPEAAREDPETVRRELGDLGRRLAPAADPEQHFERMTPAEGFLLSRVDGTLSAREVLDLAPMEREEAEYGLLRLIRNGVVGWSAAPPEPESEPPPEPERKPAPAPSAAPEAAPAPAAAGEEQAKRRQEIEDLHARLKTMTHFEALGIPRASSEKEVKAAYFALARRFHPDTHTDPGLADLEDKIEAIFIRVGEAYEVLRHRTRRADYEASLPRERPGTPTVPPAAAPAGAPAPAPPPPAPAEEDPLQVAARVSGAFKTAAKLYSAERYFDAIKLLEGHLPAAQGPIRHRMRLLLAACNAKNPAWAKQAEEIILSVLAEDPKNVQAHLQLGRLYKEKNLKARATSMFRKVLELDPENEAALAEIGPPPDQQTPPSGGLLKKFFGRS